MSNEPNLKIRIVMPFTYSEESEGVIAQALTKEIDLLAAEGLLELRVPPYRAVGDQATIDARLRSAVEKALDL